MRRSLNWKIRLLLDGIDVSGNLTNTLRIEAEEGTAKIAEFSLIPHAGPISVTKWIGKSVEIFYDTHDKEFCIFKGVVDEPIYDPTTKITTFSCTDQLQENIQRLQKLEIDELIHGHWSSIVFDLTQDNWSYAQDRLSTIPASLDLGRENHFQLTPWQAKKNPDFRFDEDTILYQSIEVQLANRRELHNQVNISFQYRYQRLKQREIQFGYGYPLNFCDQINRSATLPNVDMIQQAVSGTGWLLKNNVVFEHQRGPGWVTCGDSGFGFLIKEEMRRYLVREASFVLCKRFVQTVTENYQLQLQAPQSIAEFGKIDTQENLSFEVACNTDKFVNIKQYQSSLNDAIVDSIGDFVIEAEDRNILNHAIITKLNQAKTTILKSHRNNIISFKTPLHPLIERQHTVRLDTTNVKAQGKVKHIIHECDFNQGLSLSTISFVVSRTENDDLVAELEFTPPAKITQLGEAGYPMRISLPTHLGGKLASPEFDDLWDGYTGNEKIEANAKPYPERFAITAPAIEEAQAPVEYLISQTYELNIPNELLLLTA